MKKKIVIAVCVVLLLAILIVAIADLNRLKYYVDYPSIKYFDTAVEISGYETSQKKFDAVFAEVIGTIEEYHKLFDIYHPYYGMANLYTINQLNENGEHMVIKVDRKIIDMLLYAKEMYVKTNGKMNIAMGSVLSIWHDYRDAADSNFGVGEVPKMDKLKEAAKHTDINNLIIDEENCTVYLADPQMRLDVGAIAKGYAVEMVAQMLEEKGISGYTVNIGGNIRTVGLKANGQKWVAAVENPLDPKNLPPTAYIGLEREAIVTSGSYQRYYFDVYGNTYHHIIDGETLMPAEYFVAVSIICGHSGMGDGLSTALFCMPLEEGMAIIESLDGVEAMWTFPDGTIVKSSGFSNYEVEYNP